MRLLVCVAAMHLVACVTAPTEVLCAIDTDVPASTPLRVHVHAVLGMSLDDAGWDQTWTTAGDASGSITLPATFGIVAPPGRSSADVTIVVQADGPTFVLRAIGTAHFIPQQTVFVRLYLSRACANAATGCTRVAASACTVGERCEEQGMTCGASGECEPYVQATTDAGVLGDIPEVPEVVACGELGQACCAGGSCVTGAHCASGVCVSSCGAVGAPCCAGSSCDAGAMCIAGFCAACGSNGGACCNGNTCTDGVSTCSVASSGAQCVLPQGASCSAGQLCARGTICAGSPSTCVACGTEGHVCCAPNSCNDGTTCYATQSGSQCALVAGAACTSSDVCAPNTLCYGSPMQCRPCGTNGTPCCNGSCAAPSVCMGSSFGPLCTLAAGASCTPSDVCPQNYSCYGNPMQCRPCGTNGTPCCGGLCTAPSVCSGTAFGPICTLPAGASCTPSDVCPPNDSCYGNPMQCNPCGTSGTPCCGGLCTSPSVCTGTVFGPICETPPGTSCTSSDLCTVGYLCYGSPMQCRPCGSNGTPCCNSACNAPNQCFGTGFGPICEFPTGTACSSGQLCQPGDTCTGGVCM